MTQVFLLNNIILLMFPCIEIQLTDILAGADTISSSSPIGIMHFSLFVDYDGYSISSKRFFPAVVDILVI